MKNICVRRYHAAPIGYPRLELEHHDRSICHWHVLGQVNLLAGEDVFGRGVICDYLGVTFHRHDIVTPLAIECDKHRPPLILASDDVNAMKRDELRLVALGDNLVGLAPMQQTAEP